MYSIWPSVLHFSLVIPYFQEISTEFSDVTFPFKIYSFSNIAVIAHEDHRKTILVDGMINNLMS